MVINFVFQLCYRRNIVCRFLVFFEWVVEDVMVNVESVCFMIEVWNWEGCFVMRVLL